MTTDQQIQKMLSMRKESPILFTGSMALAAWAHTKSQTRRVVKPVGNDGGFVMVDGWPQRSHDGESLFFHEKRGGKVYLSEASIACPYGKPGDLLWGREAWRTVSDLDAFSGMHIAEMCRLDGYSAPWAPIQYEADGHRVDWRHTSTRLSDGEPRPGRYRHARFMPRWASRLLLEVTSVRVERLQAISNADAKAEGVVGVDWGHGMDYGGDANYLTPYRNLWEDLNGVGSWSEDPMVWVVEFRRITK